MYMLDLKTMVLTLVMVVLVPDVPITSKFPNLMIMMNSTISKKGNIMDTRTRNVPGSSTTHVSVFGIRA